MTAEEKLALMLAGRMLNRLFTGVKPAASLAVDRCDGLVRVRLSGLWTSEDEAVQMVEAMTFPSEDPSFEMEEECPTRTDDPSPAA